MRGDSLEGKLGPQILSNGGGCWRKETLPKRAMETSAK